MFVSATGPTSEDVVSAIDIDRFSSDQLGVIRRQDGGRDADDLRLRLRLFVLGLPDLSLGRLQLHFELDGIHARDDLAGIDHLPFADENGGNSARELGDNFDLLRFEASIGLCDARRKRKLLLLPPISATSGAGCH